MRSARFSDRERVHNAVVKKKTPPELSPALTEMLKKTGEFDQIVGGAGLRFAPASGSPVTIGAPLQIEPADWAQEEQDRRERERQAEIQRARALLEDGQE